MYKDFQVDIYVYTHSSEDQPQLLVATYRGGLPSKWLVRPPRTLEHDFPMPRLCPSLVNDFSTTFLHHYSFDHPTEKPPILDALTRRPKIPSGRIAQVQEKSGTKAVRDKTGRKVGRATIISRAELSKSGTTWNVTQSAVEELPHLSAPHLSGHFGPMRYSGTRDPKLLPQSEREHLNTSLNHPTNFEAATEVAIQAYREVRNLNHPPPFALRSVFH